MEGLRSTQSPRERERERGRGEFRAKPAQLCISRVRASVNSEKYFVVYIVPPFLFLFFLHFFGIQSRPAAPSYLFP